jgi:carbamoyl-phosphate synthase large subunit
MPRRQDLKRVLIIGSGPIVIGQACEFDYSGTQACKALMREGLEVILVNSNPATIMTDPEVATRVYVEPLTPESLDQILSIEKPQAVIPTLGGQTALNLALSLDEKGILKKHGAQLLGATPEVIKAAEDREIFRSILDEVGARYPKSEMVRTLEQGVRLGDRLGYPLILRPNYTLGGGGGGIAFSPQEYHQMLIHALSESPTSEVLVEESILGWKEFELEVMRDAAGTFVVICSIENLDPCGVHTGDSITVAPQQTLSDVEYQQMRDEAQRILNRVGLETGGANIQFAVHPTTGERVVIEMNPRVSRSSALASKATGFPIAKIAALLAVGYRLDEIQNDITRTTPSCYEPALDYVVTKIPRFAFEKFQGTPDVLSTQMKSVGEVMALGRTFQESLMKALQALEIDREGIPEIIFEMDRASYPNSKRIWHLFQAFRQGHRVGDVHGWTQITPWFLEQIHDLVQFEKEFAQLFKGDPHKALWQAKKKGFSDARLAKILGLTEKQVRKIRWELEIHPGYLQVDTCAGEFASSTPYFYSSYWSQSTPIIETEQSRVMIVGSGPNRIGQGIEFDYSCVRGVKAFQNRGWKTIMVNSNPETVSTDYDTADDLIFEPLTAESLLEIARVFKPRGFVPQLGGQTPLNLAHELVENDLPVMGSQLQAIDQAEDRGHFSQLCRDLGLQIPKAGLAGGREAALRIEDEVGYPMILRPSYVLGGRRMEVVENQQELLSYFDRHQEAISADRPCLMDQFLAGALEVDVDLVRGPDWTVIGGVVEHIEAAGVHSGDSMGVLPPQRLKDETCRRIEELSKRLAEKLEIVGHLNLQLAVKNDVIYVLEANPRSSRSLPFVAKATGIPLIDLGVAACLGVKAREMKLSNFDWRSASTVSVKGVVFPFKKFPQADSILGPEMKSTGETMGRGADYAEALMKAFISSSYRLPLQGEVFISLREKDKEPLLPLVNELTHLGYTFSATSGTAQYLNSKGIDCTLLKKVHEGRPHCVDRIRQGQVAFVINTTTGRTAIEASFDIRRACTNLNIPCLTESDAAEAFVIALKKAQGREFKAVALPPMKVL